jgi:DNA modification methylase
MLQLLLGDCRALLPTLPAGSVQCCVTSPPYWGLRDYGVAGQLGLEATPEEYIAKMVDVFREVRRVLRDDGTLWLNMGDSYASGSSGERREGTNGRMLLCRAREPVDSLKSKDLVGMPWRIAFALQADGWYLRSDIIWAKPNPMPESVTDRPTKAHEYIFLLTKAARYFYDGEAIREPRVRPGKDPGNRAVYDAGRPDGIVMRPDRGVGPEARNARSVWTIPSAAFPGLHFATFPPELARRCIVAGCPRRVCADCGSPVSDARGTSTNGARHCGQCGANLAAPGAIRPGVVLDCFAGSGTVGEVAEQNGRDAILIELSPAYGDLIRERTAQRGLFPSPDRAAAC